MRGKLRSSLLALALITCLAMAPWASAQGPAISPNMTSDGEAAWFAGFFSWWHDLWGAWGTDGFVSEVDSASSDSDFEETEPDLEPTGSGEGTESMPTGDGDIGPGADPNGSP